MESRRRRDAGQVNWQSTGYWAAARLFGIVWVTKSKLDVPERYRVSASAIRYRRIYGLLLAPFVASTLILRMYVAGVALREVGVLRWLAIAALLIFMGWLGVYMTRRWAIWAAGHVLEITDEGLLLVDPGESELRSFSDIAKLKIRKFFGKIIGVRIAYEGGVKQDLSFYERLPDLVVSLRSRLPPERVRG